MVTSICKNNELATPKNKSDEKLFNDRNIPYIEDEYEAFILELFFRALESKSGELSLNFRLVEIIAKKEELDIVEIWDILHTMLLGTNKAIGFKYRDNDSHDNS